MERPRLAPWLGITLSSPRAEAGAITWRERASGQRNTQLSLPVSWLKAGFGQQLSYLPNEASVGWGFKARRRPGSLLLLDEARLPQALACSGLKLDAGDRAWLPCCSAPNPTAASRGFWGRCLKGVLWGSQGFHPPQPHFQFWAGRLPWQGGRNCSQQTFPQPPAESWTVTRPALECNCQPCRRHPGPGLGTLSQGPRKREVNSERDQGQRGAHPDPDTHDQVKEGRESLIPGLAKPPSLRCRQ